jgi:TonB family protein
MKYVNHMAILLPLVIFAFPWSIAKGQDAKGEEIFIATEEMPTYGKGSTDLNLKKYLQKKLRYPETAVHDSIEGRVIISFCISETGSVINPCVVVGVRPDLDNECITAISGMKGWAPGRQSGVPVKVWYSLGVIFILGRSAHASGFIEVRPDAPHLEGLKVSVRPVPADDHIMVEVRESGYPLEYRIYNLCGQACASGKIGSADEKVDISGLHDGLYLIKLNAPGNISSGTGRFIKN